MDAPNTPPAGAQPLGQPVSPNSPVISTLAPDGTPLSARQRFDLWKQNPENAAAAMQPATVERQQLEQFQREMAAEADAAAGNAALAMEPAKDASAYRLGFDAASSPDLQQFDVEARGWLHAMGAPEQFGSSLAEQVADVGRRCKGADQAARDLFAQQSRRSLERVYGADTDKQIAKVDLFLDAIEPKAPGLAEFLDANAFLLGDAMVIQYLIQLADAHAARRGAA